MDKKLLEQLKSLVSDLVDENYEKLEREGKLFEGIREGLQEFIESYPGKLTMPPDSAFENPMIYEAETTKEKRVELYLWVSGSESQMTLKSIISEDSGDKSLIIYSVYC